MGWVDKRNKTTSGIAVPGGLSFLVHGDFDASIPGLDAFALEDTPGQVNAVFQFYHLMVAIGMALIGISLMGMWMWWRNIIYERKWVLWTFVFAAILPQLANQFGWFAAEMGRQPWVVYGLLRTSDAFSKMVTAQQVLFSLIMFTILYTILFLLFVYLLNNKIKHGISNPADMIDVRTHQKEITDKLLGS